MRITVIGGTGRIGSRTVTRLAELGHDVVAASRTTGVDTTTGDGLAEAVNGADVVVDVTRPASLEPDPALNFFQTSANNLIAVEIDAGVKHYVVLFVVGIDRMLASGYFRAKLAQEILISAGTTPYTIVRSTQFFGFATSIADAATIGAVRLPPVFRSANSGGRRCRRGESSGARDSDQRHHRHRRSRTDPAGRVDQTGSPVGR